MADTDTKFKSITLNVSGITFDTTFKTVVTKVVNPDENSKIVIDAMPNVQISLNGESAKSLGIEKDTQVTIKPNEGGTDGSFTLEVGEKVKTRSSGPAARGSSPARYPRMVDNLR